MPGHVDKFPFFSNGAPYNCYWESSSVGAVRLDEVVWFIEAIVIHRESLLQEPERRGAEAQKKTNYKQNMHDIIMGIVIAQRKQAHTCNARPAIVVGHSEIQARWRYPDCNHHLESQIGR